MLWTGLNNITRTHYADTQNTTALTYTILYHTVVRAPLNTKTYLNYNRLLTIETIITNISNRILLKINNITIKSDSKINLFNLWNIVIHENLIPSLIKIWTIERCELNYQSRQSLPLKYIITENSDRNYLKINNFII